VIAALGLKSGQTVADIGARTGSFTVRVARTPAAPKVYAIDVEPSKVIRHRAGPPKGLDVRRCRIDTDGSPPRRRARMS